MKTKVMASQLALVLGTTLAGPGVTSALAEESLGLEEVIVTARKREENLMEIPVSVAVVDSTIIENANLADINDLANVTPGLKYNTAFGRQADRPVIRGISSIFTTEELAGYFVDGIYVAGSLQTFDLESMERVEVMKGPQSAVFGRRTFSGAINYVTARPTEDFTGKITATLGENGREELSAAISDTIDSFGYRINVRTSDYDGDFNNTLEGGPDVGGQSSDSINGSFRWDLSDTTVLHFNAGYVETDDEHYVVVLQPSSENNCTFGTRQYYCGTLKTDVPVSLGGYMNDSDYGLESETLRTSIRLEHDFGFADFTWTSAYNTYEVEDGTDQTWSGKQIAFDFGAYFGGGNPFVPASQWHDRGVEDVDDMSHELWLRGLAMKERLSWSVGAYYYDEESDGKGWDGDGVITSITSGEVTNTAFMGSVEYDFTDAFTLGLELRYAEDEITEVEELDGDGGIEYNETFDSTTYRLTGSYTFDNGTMLYGNWSTGVMPGQFNTNPDLPDNLIPVDEQELEQFEIGVKSDISDTLSLTAAVFMMEWTDQVRSEFYTGGGNPVGYKANQGDSDINGVEMDVNWQALDSLLISGGFSYNDTEVNNFVSSDPTDVAITGDGDVSGAQLPLSPEWEGHIAGTHTWDFDNGLQLVSRLDVSYQDSRYTCTVNLAETGSETLVNLNIALSGESWRVAVWGKNLTDEDAIVSSLRYVEADSFFWSGRAFALTPRPGTEWGITATYNF